MSRCIAFRVVPGCPNAWFRCGAKALRHSGFCRRHLDAIHGAMLGLMEHQDRCERDATSNLRGARGTSASSGIGAQESASKTRVN